MDKQKEIKTALITGAARRVGADIARGLHHQGFNIVIHYRSSKREALQLERELNSIRANSTKSVSADLSKFNELETLANKAIRCFGRCDILINNASSFFATPVSTVTESQWNNLFDSNAKAPFFLAQFLKQELTQNKGSIINIADIHAQRPLKNHTVYCMAKASNLMLTKSLALELAPHVRVNSVSPGAILWPESETGTLIENPEITDKIPLKKIGGTSSIVDSILFLISNANYITGQNINVDGGRTLLQ